MIRWEYKKVSLSGTDNELDDRYLNSLGLEGWEAISIIAATHPPQAGNHNAISVLLKRQIAPLWAVLEATIELSDDEEVEAALAVWFGVRSDVNIARQDYRDRMHAALRAARLASLGRGT